MAPITRSAKSPKIIVSENQEPPFPNPTECDGPPVPPPRPALPRRMSQFVRSGTPGFGDTVPIGFPLAHNMCYRNAALSLLMNVTPLVGYLDHFTVGTRATCDNVLLELGEMATVYWSQDSEKKRREELEQITDRLWAHLLHFDNDDRSTTAWGPFLDSQQLEMQQDASDFLENLLGNADVECEYRPKDRAEYNAVVESTFQVRTACAGNCENVRTRAAELDRTHVWTLAMDHSKGRTGGTLEDAIRRTITNEIDLTCEKCKRLRKEHKMGRIWLRMRDVPEVLFIRIARFQRSRRGRCYRKCNDEVLVPEILDLTPFLEDVLTTPAKFRLAGTICHAGTMDSGHFVSHVRGQSRNWYRLDDEVVTPSSIATLNDDPVRFGKKYRFTPYVLAYTRVFDGDVSPDPPLRPPSPVVGLVNNSSASASGKGVQFRVRVKLAGQSFTMTHKLKGFEKIEDQPLSMQIDVVGGGGGQGNTLSADPITTQLMVAREEGETEAKVTRRTTTTKKSSGPPTTPTKSPKTAKPRSRENAAPLLPTPDSTPKKQPKTAAFNKTKAPKILDLHPVPPTTTNPQIETTTEQLSPPSPPPITPLKTEHKLKAIKVLDLDPLTPTTTTTTTTTTGEETPKNPTTTPPQQTPTPTAVGVGVGLMIITPESSPQRKSLTRKTTTTTNTGTKTTAVKRKVDVVEEEAEEEGGGGGGGGGGGSSSSKKVKVKN